MSCTSPGWCSLGAGSRGSEGVRKGRTEPGHQPRALCVAKHAPRCPRCCPVPPPQPPLGCQSWGQPLPLPCHLAEVVSHEGSASSPGAVLCQELLLLLPERGEQGMSEPRKCSGQEKGLGRLGVTWAVQVPTGVCATLSCPSCTAAAWARCWRSPRPPLPAWPGSCSPPSSSSWALTQHCSRCP